MKTTIGLLVRTLFSAFLLSIVTFQVEGVGQPSNEILVAKRAKQDDLIEPQKFEFSIGQVTYRILSNGDGVRTDSKGKSMNFTLPLESGYYVERVDCLEMEVDLI